jgi:hypothetical protein
MKPYLKARERDAYGSYHESCTCAMSHFTIKWKARERGNYGCEKALDILLYTEKKIEVEKKNSRFDD